MDWILLVLWTVSQGVQAGRALTLTALNADELHYGMQLTSVC